MNPDKIELETINKSFEYEKQVRIIEKLNTEELKEFAKLYCKLYFKQQEIVSLLGLNET